MCWVSLIGKGGEHRQVRRKLFWNGQINQFCSFCYVDVSLKYKKKRRHYLSVHKVIPEYYLTLRLNPMPELVCDICGEKFGRKDSLDKHKALQLCSTFNCSLCKFSSNDKNEFDNHLEVPHLRCDYCDFQTIYKKNLVRHLKKHR